MGPLNYVFLQKFSGHVLYQFPNLSPLIPRNDFSIWIKKILVSLHITWPCHRIWCITRNYIFVGTFGRLWILLDPWILLSKYDKLFFEQTPRVYTAWIIFPDQVFKKLSFKFFTSCYTYGSATSREDYSLTAWIIFPDQVSKKLSFKFFRVFMLVEAQRLVKITSQSIS
jgi:hypothetical protein